MLANVTPKAVPIETPSSFLHILPSTRVKKHSAVHISNSCLAAGSMIEVLHEAVMNICVAT